MFSISLDICHHIECQASMTSVAANFSLPICSFLTILILLLFFDIIILWVNNLNEGNEIQLIVASG